MRKVIAVDFDGTLFENAWPGIGAPRANVIAAALREQQNGAALILWTCRTGEALRAALQDRHWKVPVPSVRHKWRSLLLI